MTSRNRFGLSILKVWIFLMLSVPYVIARGGAHAGGGRGGGAVAGGGRAGGHAEGGTGGHSGEHAGGHEGGHGGEGPKGPKGLEEPKEPEGPKGSESSETTHEVPDSDSESESEIGSGSKPHAVPKPRTKTRSIHSRGYNGAIVENGVHYSGSRSAPQTLPTLSLNRNNESVYYTDVSIGTPGQRQKFFINLVEPYSWAAIGKPRDDNDNTSGNSLNGYDASSSRTSKKTDGSHIYHFDFINLQNISASAVQDTISFDGVSLQNQTLHPSNNSMDDGSWVSYNRHSLVVSNSSFFEVNKTSRNGMLGLGGLISDEIGDTDSSQFDSSFFFLENLRDNGIIASSSYSLWLGGDTRYYDSMGPDVPDEIDCGKLILGGVDPYYYTGPMKKFNKSSFFDIRTNMPSRGYPILPMGPINVVSSSGASINVTNEKFLAPALLDSRYTFSYLPAETVVQIAVQLNAIYLKEIDRFMVSCDIADMGSIQFEFGDISIDVPLIDFLVSSYRSSFNSTMGFSGGGEACFLTIVSSEETGFNILGNSLLKNIYLAVDHDDQTIGIAQARRKHTTLITPDIAGSNSPTTFSYMSPSLSSTKKAQQISSGSIPYATSADQTAVVTLTPSPRPSSNSRIPDQFTATLFPNGLISTGRSFYNTYRSSSATSSAPTDFASLSVTSASPSSSSTKHGNKDSGAYKLKPLQIHNKNWMPHVFALLLFVLPLMLC